MYVLQNAVSNLHVLFAVNYPALFNFITDDKTILFGMHFTFSRNFYVYIATSLSFFIDYIFMYLYLFEAVCATAFH